MKIVIDIPDEMYMDIKEEVRTKVNTFEHIPFLHEVISVGTPLPKGHGTLKDMGNLKYVFDLTRDDPIYSGKDIERAIKSMTSIIKADKVESEE